MGYKRAHKVPWRIVDEKAVLVSVDNSEVLVLNEVGSEIWKYLDAERTEQDIVEHLSGLFASDEDTIRKDLADFVNELSAKEVISVL